MDDASTRFDPREELVLGICRKDNLRYKLSDNAEVTTSNEVENSTILDPEERAAIQKQKFGVQFLKETALFLIFTTIVVCFVVLNNPPWGYESVRLVTEMFVNKEVNDDEGKPVSFYKVSNSGQIKDWIELVLLPSAYRTTNEMGAPLSSYDRQFIIAGNRLLGPVRLRQVRLKGLCSVPSVGRATGAHSCSGSISFDNILKEDYGRQYSILQQPVDRSHSVITKFTEKLANGASHLEEFAEAENITWTEDKFKYRSAAELCREDPNPARDLGTIVDRMGRAVRGNNEGLMWYCEVGAAVRGKSGVYPNGGFVLDLPPVSWFKAWSEYQTTKLVLTVEWDDKYGPKGYNYIPSATRTQTPFYSKTMKVMTPTATDSYEWVNGTETEIFLKENTTATVVPPTETTPILGTQTLIDYSINVPELPSKVKYSQEAIDDFFSHKWIDNQTAMILAEFTIYNADTKMLTACRFIFEVLPTGGIHPSISIKPLILPERVTFTETFTFLCEIMIAMFLVYFIWKESKKIKKYFSTSWKDCQVCSMAKIRSQSLATTIVCPNCQRPFCGVRLQYCPDCYFDVHIVHVCWKGYFQDIWNGIDIANIVLFIAVLSFRFKLRSDYDKINLRTETQFIQFYPLAWQYGLTNYLNSANILLTFIKTIKYLGKVKALSTTVITLAKAMAPVFWFLVIFAIVYIGFSMAFLLSFGKDLVDVSTMGNSYMSLFLMILGSFNYLDMYESSRIMTPILFLIYNFGVVLICANIFISILDGAYCEASKEVKESRDNYLNTALRMLTKKFIRMVKRTCGTPDSVHDNMVTLLKNIYNTNGLLRMQKDDLRGFLKQINEDPDRELFHEILHVFHHDVTRVMRVDDYHMLRLTVVETRRMKEARERSKQSSTLVWTQEEQEGGMGMIPTSKDIGKQRRSTIHRNRREGAAMGRRLKDLENSLEMIVHGMATAVKVAGLTPDNPPEDPPQDDERAPLRGTVPRNE